MRGSRAQKQPTYCQSSGAGRAAVSENAGQLYRAVCRLGDRLLASQGNFYQPGLASSLREGRLPSGIHIQPSLPVGMLRSYHL